jgi:hypothetical protein
MFSKVAKRKVVRTPTDPGDEETVKRLKLPTTIEMFEQGQLVAGDVVMIKNQEASAATVVDYKTVNYSGNDLSWNKWAKQITKWSAVNIYANVTKNGKTLDELRGNVE